jgi:hypothetical protein
MSYIVILMSFTAISPSIGYGLSFNYPFSPKKSAFRMLN